MNNTREANTIADMLDQIHTSLLSRNNLLITGPFGIGKSVGVEAVAKKIAKFFYAVSMAHMDPVEVSGYVLPTKEQVEINNSWVQVVKHGLSWWAVDTVMSPRHCTLPTRLFKLLSAKGYVGGGGIRKFIGHTATDIGVMRSYSGQIPATLALVCALVAITIETEDDEEDLNTDDPGSG